jgi:hypothetical protein
MLAGRLAKRYSVESFRFFNPAGTTALCRRRMIRMADTAQDASEKRVREEERSGGAPPQRIFLVPYPKIIFLYPSFFAALAAGAVLYFFSQPQVGPSDVVAVVCSVVFLGILAINLVVLSFDFPRGTSLTLFFLLAAIALGATVLFILRPEVLPAISNVLKQVQPVANATFYFVVAGILAALYAVMFVIVRFDYWEVRPNELLHHHGLLSDLKRYAAPNLRIDKEINDVFEYMLLRSGRLILHPSGERRAIILDNIPFISQKEEQITKMLGALQVQVRTEER